MLSGEAVSYRYDGDGHRVQQVDFTEAESETATYTNDNTGLSSVLVASNGITNTTNLTGLDLTSHDNGNEVRTFLTDGLGSNRIEMVGSSIRTVTTYEPFGRVLAYSGASGIVYGYAGEQFDTATGLVYLRARYYNSTLKLFMSRDPFPGWSGLPASQHGYSYAHNNPLNFTDPTGHISCDLLGDANDIQGCNNPTSPKLVNFSGTWSESEKATVTTAAWMYAVKLATTMNSENPEFSTSPTELFLQVFGGPVTFNRETQSCQQALGYKCYAKASSDTVRVFTNADGNVEGNIMFVLHELTHSFNANAIPLGETLGRGYIELENNPIIVNGKPISPIPAEGRLRTTDGYRPPIAPSDRTPYRQSWQDESIGEDFADMGANWVANSFAPDMYGAARNDWMNGKMSNLIMLAVDHNR